MDPNEVQRWDPLRLLPAEVTRVCSSLGCAVRHPKPGIAPSLPAGLGYTRDEPLRSQFTKSETRHLEPANESAATPGNFASVNDTRGTGVTRELRERGIILLRLQLGAPSGIFFYRRAFSLIAINPGSLGHNEVRTITSAAEFATGVEPVLSESACSSPLFYHSARRPASTGPGSAALLFE